MSGLVDAGGGTVRKSMRFCRCRWPRATALPLFRVHQDLHSVLVDVSLLHTWRNPRSPSPHKRTHACHPCDTRQQAFPRRIRAALIDLNGTLHVGDAATPGAQAALQRLRASGVAARFVTNTTKDTVANLLALVQGLGFAIQRDEVEPSAKRVDRRRRQRLRCFAGH